MSRVCVTVEGYGRFEVDPGDTLLEVCETHEIPIEAECGGFAACNSCRVRVIAHPEGLSETVEEELPFLDAHDQRLGCQAQVVGNVTVALDPGI